MKRVLAIVVIAIASMFALSACDATSNVEKLKSLGDIRYTGDPETDLKSLCQIGSVVTEVNNDVNIEFNGVISSQVNEFAEKSSDERVRALAKGVALATSLDETSREAGEQMINDTCNAIWSHTTKGHLINKYGPDGQTKPQQKQQKLQTLRVRLNIADNDYNRMVAKAQAFLEKRKQVRFSVMLRGREKAHPQKGVDLLLRIAEELKDYGVLSKQPNSQNLNVVFNPKKK